jgi:serine/threonine-protein kinase
MEYLDGRALDEIIEGDGAMEAGRVVHVLKQVAAALVHAHGEGLIHRDIKPANIMLTLPHRHGGVHELVKLLDFGLVREVHDGQIDLSRTDTVSGTPQYMSPEAIRNPSALDGRSDLYSVGAVAYYLLTGQHVFSGSTVVEVCSHHLHSAPAPLRERVSAPVSAELEALILRCLEKDPAARPASALELAVALDRLTDVAVWSPRAALDWWTTHGARLRNRSTIAVADTAVLTVEVRPSRRV